MGSSRSTSRSSGGGNNNKPKYGMGPGQSMAMSGTTGLATATTRQAETIKRNTGKSFNAISKDIGEIGSKYRRPANVEKFAKDLQTQEVGEMLGGKKFTGPDGVERMSFVGTGLKNEKGETILSKQTPQLTANAPTMKQAGGDIARGLMGYNTLKYVDGTNKVEMVKEKGLIPSLFDAAVKGKFSPIGAALSIGNNFFSYGDASKDNQSQDTVTNLPESDIRENERKMRIAKRLANLGNTQTDNTRPFLTVKRQGFGGTMSNV